MINKSSRNLLHKYIDVFCVLSSILNTKQQQQIHVNKLQQ